MASIITLIEKEAVSFLKFPDKEVLQESYQILQRLINLQRALALGNDEKIKVKITFEDETSKKMVETTVWGVTDKKVILKQGVIIPIKRIHYVRF